MTIIDGHITCFITSNVNNDEFKGIGDQITAMLWGLA